MKEMWLSMELGSVRPSFALHQLDSNGEVNTLEERELPPGPTHSESLLPSLGLLFNAHGTSLAQIHRLITSTGPGSFTGMRVAYATLKAFALALHCPLDTLSGLEARALAWTKGHGPLSPESRLLVTSPLTQERLAYAEFRASPQPGLELLGEGVGEKATVLNKIVEHRIEESDFPLRARYLGEGLLNASSRKTHHTLAAWIEAQPRYLGSTNYRIS